LKHIVIFASGSGSNAENIVNYFKTNKHIEVTLIATNNPQAGVIERAKRLNISSKVFNRKQLNDGDILLWPEMAQADLIVLSGFLWKIPSAFITKFPNKIINIHPALLPKYGGKGMYGDRVHQNVVANKELESGITIHYVNENYDEGAVIFQKSFTLNAEETPETLAQKIHKLEYKHYPKIIDKLLHDATG
jgi:phosphoribosylglycinamide formyltransferase 1